MEKNWSPLNEKTIILSNIFTQENHFMKKNILSSIFSFVAFAQVIAQTGPEVTSWIINTNGATGYANISTNVQQVQYSTGNVYVSATCIPGYDIGPWAGNPNVPANQNFVFKITRTPVQNTGVLVNVGLGHIGVWSNGVSIFNAKDGMSYNNAGVWNRNALYYEGASFDTCLGHPAPNGEYHHHVNPRCLYDDTDSLTHSPIIGYAFDGFPIYGAYSYTNVNGTGPIKRMKSSYVLSGNATRANGPNVSVTYPAGCYVEDYIYTAGSGDLDDHNGRFCVTPDYPNGIYAYFVTIDNTLYPIYPFVLGSTYYGTVQAGNTGPGGGHNTISEPVTTYVPNGINARNIRLDFETFPNPATDYLTLYVTAGQGNNLSASLYNNIGEVVLKKEFIQPAVPYTLNFSNLPAGMYYLELSGDGSFTTRKVLVVK
jgi:hypothetical protein